MNTTHPNSIDAENGVLACILLEGGDHLSWFMDRGLAPTYFYDHLNRAIFLACLEVDAAGQQPSFGSLVSHMRIQGRHIDGTMPRLTDITAINAGTSTREYMFAALKDRWQRRQALEYIASVSEKLTDVSQEVIPAISDHVERLSSIWMGGDRRSWKQAVNEAEEAIRNDMLPPNERKATESISWGFPVLDRVFCEMELGEVITVAARTSNGKSSFARQVWIRAAMRGVPSLLHTLEVTDSELARNLAANVSGVRSRRDLHRLRRDDQEQLLEACEMLRGIPAGEVCDSENTLSRMLSAARAFKRRHGLKLWVIDYLGLIADTQSASKGENVATAIGRVTSGLKQFAQRERIVIIMLVQISRAGDECPTLVHLKDSGRIEDDSNRVIIIHRPKTYRQSKDGPEIPQDLDANADEEPKFFCEVKQAKGRNHGTGEVGMWFIRETASFAEVKFGQ